MKVEFTLFLTVNFISCYAKPNGDDVLELIDKAGYIGETHKVITEDGYILKLHRIPPRFGNSTKPPVFLMHGLFATASDYLITGPKIALGYFLADNNFDGRININFNKRHEDIAASILFSAPDQCGSEIQEETNIQRSTKS